MEKSKLQNKLSSIDSFLRVLIAEKFNPEPGRLAKMGKMLPLEILRDNMKNCEIFINIDIHTYRAGDLASLKDKIKKC